MFQIPDVINSLNNIEVKGKDNLDRLLGAIMALEAIQAAQNNAQEENVVEEPTEDKGE